MNIDNGLELLVAVVFAMSTLKTLWFNFDLEKGKYYHNYTLELFER